MAFPSRPRGPWRRAPVVAVLGALAVALFSVSACGATYFVAPGGNDQATGDSPAAAFKTVDRAALALRPGDRLVIAPGAYSAQMELRELIPAGESETVIEGDESGKKTGAANGRVILRPSGSDAPALSLRRCQNIRVSGITFTGGGLGIAAADCRDARIERCSFEKLARGIALESSKRVRVESSVFLQCAVGALSQGCDQTRFAHLSVGGSTSAGLLILASSRGSIRNSLFVDNNANFVADSLSAPSWTSDHNVLTGVTGPWGQVGAIAHPAEWPAATGQDRHSVFEAPQFAPGELSTLRPKPEVHWPGGVPGAFVGEPLDPPVALDRDGAAFPDPPQPRAAGAFHVVPRASGEGPWKPLGVSIDSDRPRQSAGIYDREGRLLRMLLADVSGVRDLWWDGLDDLGRPVPSGSLKLKMATHDLRWVDDGAFGDNGSAEGAFNPDRPDRVAPLPNGGFLVTSSYDEAGFPLRRFSAQGHARAAVNLDRKEITAIAAAGDDVYAAVGKGEASLLIRLDATGQRKRMPNGAEAYSLFEKGEAPEGAQGLAIVDGKIAVAAPDLDAIRVMDLQTGREVARWPLTKTARAKPADAGVADLAADPDAGRVWALLGSEALELDWSGQIVARVDTGLPNPRRLDARKDRLAVLDPSVARVALFDLKSRRLLRTLGAERKPGEWTPVDRFVLRAPGDCAFLANGRLLITEHARMRMVDPDSGVVLREMLSNFMDVATPHPLHPEFVYCALGIFHVDSQSGAWTWRVEAPEPSPPNSPPPAFESPGSPSGTVVLQGRPFLVHAGHNGKLRLFDITDPERPRLALEPAPEHSILRLVPYSTISFARNGDIIANSAHYSLEFVRIPFQGLTEQGNPRFDFRAPRRFGPRQDPDARGMQPVNALSADPATDDVYYLAITARRRDLVAGWGADGTGVGKSSPNGTPLWFSPSSGGTYQSGAAIHDGRQTWYVAGKSFGGQLDLFDSDGLRLTTGNWGFPCNFGIGFVDLRYGVQPFIRADGKLGVYVEDDHIGRFARARLDGAETLRKQTQDIRWEGGSDAGDQNLQTPRGGSLASLPPLRHLSIPKVDALPIDGDWTPWARAGVAPQILCLPIPGWVRHWPPDLWQTFRAGAAVGAIARDDASLLLYILVTDDTPAFHATDPARMWEFDSLEIWIEEEQFGLGILKDGRPALFKYRHHNRQGKEWAANYALPSENVWGAVIPDVSRHPLGRDLSRLSATSLNQRAGYALSARIPYSEIRLSRRTSSNPATAKPAMRGTAGETIRLGIAIDGVEAWGREQDFKIYWPAGLMFSDPTRNMVCVLE